MIILVTTKPLLFFPFENYFENIFFTLGLNIINIFFSHILDDYHFNLSYCRTTMIIQFDINFKNFREVHLICASHIVYI